MRILFSRNLAYAKFRENKTLVKISEFTVHIKGSHVRISKLGCTIFQSQKIGFILANSADLDEMPQSAVFHLGLQRGPGWGILVLDFWPFFLLIGDFQPPKIMQSIFFI